MKDKKKKKDGSLTDESPITPGEGGAEEKKEPAIETKNETEMVEITPLKDWLLHCPPHIVNTQLKEGVSAIVPVIVISSLKTSKVID